jgi:ATP-dependent Clp protease ATP-binding subunit ClpX
MEDSKVRIAPGGGRKHPEKELLEIDTKNILFICSGAFVGIERQIGRRMKMNAVGFANEKERQKVDNTNLLKYITTEDIRSYGIIPELVGRLPIITYVNELDKEALKRILVEPKNAIIKQYVKLFEMDGVKLVFNDDTLDYIVDKAVTMKLGARSLRSIVEEIMTQYMFDIPTSRKKKLVVTKEYAQSILEPTLAETV